jgi:quercetin dioxygenase-like cupin family protein
MSVRVISLDSIPAQVLPGRTLQWFVTPETMGTERLAVNKLQCPPGAVVRPLHAHRDTEEAVLVLEGQGEAWIDGEVSSFKKGDAVFYPANSKHMIRNTGSETLVAFCLFSPPTKPDSYVFYEEGGPNW